MIRFRRHVYLSLLLGLLACGGRVDNSSGHEHDGVGGAPSSEESGVSDSAPDSSSHSTSPSDSSAPADLGVGSWDGPSHPDDFRSLSWNREHEGCGGFSKCTVFVTLDAACSLVIAADDVPHTLTMRPADCLAFKQWLTSDRLLAGLRDLARCPTIAEKGNPESTQVELVSGVVGGKYDKSCTVEPFSEHRTVLQNVIDVHVPGVSILP